MNQPADYHRAAIVLGVLGDSERETVLRSFQTEVADRLREQLQQFEQESPGITARDETLDEFQRTLRFALVSQPEAEAEAETEHQPELSLFVEAEEDTEKFLYSSDPVADLSRLKPFQIAGALQGEVPSTVAMVLGTLDDDHGGEVLRLLPEELQAQAFIEMQSALSPTRPLLVQVAAATLERALTVMPAEISSGKPTGDERMAGMLRKMSRRERSNILETLELQDQDSAVRIRNLLFRFEDLERLQRRSLQKLLGEVDTTTLARSLFGSSPELIQRVQECMSQRAWSGVEEELELAPNANPDDLEAAKTEVIHVMVKMDQSGDLEMEEEENS